MTDIYTRKSKPQAPKLNIGRFNSLKVVKIVDFGVFLDGGDTNAGGYGNILLPKRYVPESAELGDSVHAFIYTDSNDELIATTLEPKIQVGECAYMKVKDVNDMGAFLDWGLTKDLFVPFKEQHKPYEVGKSYVVYAYQDRHSERILASSRLSRHLSELSTSFEAKQKVNLLICGRSEMGYKAVVNNRYLGLVFRDDAFKTVYYGQKLPGYIKAIRDDGKIDLSLQLPSGMGKKDLSAQIIDYLKAAGGSSSMTDRADPEDIYDIFNVSKKNYKKALGALYKQRRITISPDKIQLTDE